MTPKRRRSRNKKGLFWRLSSVRLFVRGIGLVVLVGGSFGAGAYWGARRAVANKMRSLPEEMRQRLDAYWDARLRAAQAHVDEATTTVTEAAKKVTEKSLEESFSSLDKKTSPRTSKKAPTDEKGSAIHPYAHAFDFAWPTYSVEDAIAEHQSLTVCYAPQALQTRWVAYAIKPNGLSGIASIPKLDFQPDPMLKQFIMPSSSDYDAKYEMVSLVPFQERSEHPKHIQESFYMSLVCPQTPALGAVWRTLSKRTYRWARHHAPLYVVAGPVLARAPRMRNSRVRIPSHFFKALLVLDDTQPKAIGFLIPQTPDPTQSVMNYACSLREIEKQTGLVLFPQLPAALSDQLKSNVDPKLWP